MLGIECLKKINPICISKRLGLYIKNADCKFFRQEIKYLLYEDYHRNFEKDYHFRKKILSSLNDEYYSGLLKKDISKLTAAQILSLISKYIIVFDYEYSESSLLVGDEIFSECKEDELSKELHKTPLINPTNEYDIEYKFLFLYNFVERSKGKKRNDLDILFNTGCSDWPYSYIFNMLMQKTYKSREENQSYIFYKYYKNYNSEFANKINGLIKFGKKYDKIVVNSDEYFKLDFIAEILLSADKSQYSLLNYVLLIEMLIINPVRDTRSQLKDKLKFFVDDLSIEFENEIDVENFSTLIYDIRSRLIHGNFNSLKKELFKYKKNYLKNFTFDYGEYKEENWIIGHLNLELRNILKNIMYKYFNKYEMLKDFKYDRIKKI